MDPHTLVSSKRHQCSFVANSSRLAIFICSSFLPSALSIPRPAPTQWRELRAIATSVCTVPQDGHGVIRPCAIQARQTPAWSSRPSRPTVTPKTVPRVHAHIARTTEPARMGVDHVGELGSGGVCDCARPPGNHARRGAYGTNLLSMSSKRFLTPTFMKGFYANRP